MPEKHHAPDILDFDDEPSSEELQAQVQRAQAELSELKRRSEQIEKDKQRLEELSRRQDELESGRAEMLDKFTRSMVILQRETEETEKRLEQLHAIHNSFLTHLRNLEGINPKSWTAGELPKELSKALSAVDDARADYSKSQARLTVESGGEPAPTGAPGEYDEYYAGEKGFVYWLTAGFAFTLPVMALAIVLAVLFGFHWMGGAS